MYDRLPTPTGWSGSASPGPSKIKNVTATFDKTAAQPGFRFFGHVELGKDVTLDDLRAHYHQIVYTTGAQTDRHMGIPGEDLPRSYPATDFVAWYNGHPDYQDHRFDLSQECVAVVGVGNVAVDVVRILCRTPEELATTDISDRALAALRDSRVREVYLLGRRGPAQASFTNPEIRELGELPGADVIARPDETEPDPLTRAELERSGDRGTLKKVEILREYARRPRSGKPRQLVIRFLVSPVALQGDDNGAVVGMRLVKNELQATAAGTPRPHGPVRGPPGGARLSVGRLPRGADSRRAVQRRLGRDPERQGARPRPGHPGAAGRGIRPDGSSAARPGDRHQQARRRGDRRVHGRGRRPGPAARASEPESGAALALVQQRQPHSVSWADWLRLDALEVERGRAAGRPRIKFTRVEEMLAALRK
jgi:ferredoxin--NADP+ reductase